MDLLVSYPRGCYGAAKREIARILARFGDARPLVEKSGTPGILEKRGWAQYHTAEIIRRLAEAINRRVRLNAPDKLVRIDILGAAVAVSMLRQGESFSIYSPS